VKLKGTGAPAVVMTFSKYAGACSQTALTLKMSVYTIEEIIHI
jgi:hypothetical protein